MDAISQAAEVEHALACAYLYSGFSLKERPDDRLSAADAERVRGWKTTLFLIARQEMEHLGLAANLLTAIGGAPDLARPPFPVARSDFAAGLRLDLRPLDRVALRQFVCYERPDGVAEPECDRLTAGSGESIQHLYEAIRAGFESLEARLGAKRLFVGPTSAQVGNAAFGWAKSGHYDVSIPAVTDLASAKQTIDQIIREGEGAPGDHATSHYGRLKRMMTEYDDLERSGGVPARACVENPVTAPASVAGTGAIGGTRLTHPLALDAARLFEGAYVAMLLMLERYYARTDETREDIAALQQIAFFPMMTMLVRPLGEVMTEIPAFAGGGAARAGAPFETERLVRFLPHKRAAWTVIHDRLSEVAADAGRVARAAEAAGEPCAERLAFVHENAERIAWTFGEALDALGKRGVEAA